MSRDPIKIRAIELLDRGERIVDIRDKLKIEFPSDPIKYRTVYGWCEEQADDIRKLSNKCSNEPLMLETKGSEQDRPKDYFDSNVKTLIFDIETLPNGGFFFDTFSDRGIPLPFVRKHKAVCTIAYKWLGEAKTNVLVMEAPYNDKSILDAFLPIYEQAHYVVAHYGDGFDIPFIDGRLFANGMPQLPKKRSLDTYKAAKKRFGRTLNSNKLDHLATLLEVGNKNKTDSMLWVNCAEGDKEALKEMALYNVQDVELLEKVFMKLRPYFADKMNMNLFIDDITKRCKSCGSDNLTHIGYELTSATMRDQYRCECGAISSFKQVKHEAAQ
jgi:uncharacterized protein YprB with RNaseH-like and TPR domain